jgi:hypothetical protein
VPGCRYSPVMPDDEAPAIDEATNAVEQVPSTALITIVDDLTVEKAKARLADFLAANPLSTIGEVSRAKGKRIAIENPFFLSIHQNTDVSSLALAMSCYRLPGMRSQSRRRIPPFAICFHFKHM